MLSIGLRCVLLVLMVLTQSCSAEKQETPETALTSNEQAVFVYFLNYGSSDLSRLFSLEDRVGKALIAADAGELDGHEINIDGTDGQLYMYGPDADRIFETVKPILASTDFTRGARVVKRYGGSEDGVRQTTFFIAP